MTKSEIQTGLNDAREPWANALILCSKETEIEGGSVASAAN
jgi:hypothetical protein